MRVRLWPPTRRYPYVCAVRGCGNRYATGDDAQAHTRRTGHQSWSYRP